MRIAALADIHGNVLALERVIADLRAISPDLTLNLGDCLSGPLWPNETADILIGMKWPTVRGNHDRYLTDLSPDDMGPSDLFAHERINNAHREWLRGLPLQYRHEDVLMFHAQPQRDDAYLMEAVTPDGRVVAAASAHVAARLRGTSAPLMLCGHTHIPRIMRLANGDSLANPGSVGDPGFEDTAPVYHRVETGLPHARYLICTRTSQGWEFEMRILAYDWHKAAQRAAGNGRPEWACALLTGFLPEKATCP